MVKILLNRTAFYSITIVFAQYFSTEVCFQPINGCFLIDGKRIKVKKNVMK